MENEELNFDEVKSMVRRGEISDLELIDLVYDEWSSFSPIFEE